MILQSRLIHRCEHVSYDYAHVSIIDQFILSFHSKFALFYFVFIYSSFFPFVLRPYAFLSKLNNFISHISHPDNGEANDSKRTRCRSRRRRIRGNHLQDRYSGQSLRSTLSRGSSQRDPRLLRKVFIYT